MLRSNFAAAENDTIAVRKSHDVLTQQHESHFCSASDIFQAIYAATGSLEQARLGLLPIRTMSRTVPLYLGSYERLMGDFCSISLVCVVQNLHGQIDPGTHETLSERDEAWKKYAETI